MKKIINLIKKINVKYNNFIKKYKTFSILPSNIYLFISFLIILFLLIPNVINNYTVVSGNKIVDFKEALNISYDGDIFLKKTPNESVKIGIMFGTYDRVNTSNYLFKLYDNDKVIYKKKFSSKNVKNLEYYVFNTSKLRFKSGKHYRIELSGIDSSDGNLIAVGVDKSNNISYCIIYKSEFYNLVIGLCVIFLILFFGFNYFINNEKIKGEKFLIALLLYFIPILLLYPPFQTPDEPYHFYSSYRLSQASFDKDITNSTISLPRNINCLNYSSPRSINNVKNMRGITDCSKETKNISFKYDSKTSSFLGHIPSAIGIKIADILTDSPLIIFYSGRLFNLLFSFLIILYAYKILPENKKIILLFVSIPVFVQQMISYSYDSMLNALCILIISYLFKFYSDDKIQKKDLIIYIISTIIVSEIKLPYILVSIPIIFIDNEKFGENKFAKFKTILLLLISVFIYYLFTKYVTVYKSTFVSKSNSNFNNSLFDLVHPRKAFLVITKTLLEYTMFYLKSFVGNLGWLQIKMPIFTIYLFYFILIICLLSCKNSYIKKKNRISNVLLSLLLMCGIFAAMYVGWTLTGENVIQGVQGRYFYPSIFLICLSILPKKKIIDLSDKFIYSYVNISLFTLCVTLLYTFF